jgi:hypothetical protein
VRFRWGLGMSEVGFSVGARVRMAALQIVAHLLGFRQGLGKV